jgi:CheY-like chemotaxis protein
MPTTILFPATSDVVSLITGLAWPVLVLVVVLVLLKPIRNVIESRAFTIKIGGNEISVQQASQQLADRFDDLRDHVLSTDAAAASPPLATPGHDVAAEAGAVEPVATAAISRLSAVLWVDDYPSNNAFEVDTLQRRSVTVVQVETTADALREVNARRFDVVITDMGRDKDGNEAGLDLIRRLRALQITTPVIVYTSARAAAASRDQAIALGAYGVTASATELIGLLARLGLSPG